MKIFGLSTLTCVLIMSYCIGVFGMLQEKHPVDYFMHLPQEAIKHIFLQCNEKEVIAIWSIDRKSILIALRTIISLSRVCKRFNLLLGDNIITALFKSYSPAAKNWLLNYIICHNEDEEYAFLFPMECDFYPSKRRFVLALLHSGAELHQSYYEGSFDKGKYLASPYNRLVSAAFEYDDVDSIKLLCSLKQVKLSDQHWNDLEYKGYNWRRGYRDNLPLCFYARSAEMAEVCEQNTDNLYAFQADYLFPNILWMAVANHSIPAHMVEFYLKKGVSTQCRPCDGQTLLHELASRCDNGIVSVSDVTIRKAKILLSHQPTFINARNKDKKTPLDHAQWALDHACCRDSPGKFVAFLKENGGKYSKKSLNKNREKCVLS